MGTMFPHSSSMFAYLHQLPSSSSPNSISATTINIQEVVNGSSPFWGASEQEMHLQAAMGNNAHSSSIMSSHITNSGLIPSSSLINQMAREGQLFSQLSMETQMYFHSDGKMEEEGIVDMEKLHNWVPPTGCIPEYNEGEKEEEEEEGEEEEECMRGGGGERGMMRKRVPSTTRMVSSSSKTPTDSQDDSSSSSISKRQRCALPIPPQQQQEEEGERCNKDIMSAPLHENKTRPTPPVSRRPSKDTKRSTITRAVDDQTRDFVHVRARRGQATDSHSLAERVRREKISQRMRLLQDLVPGCNKTIGKAMMLDEIINYVQCLQNQVEFLSMKLAELSPRIDFEIDGLINGEVLSKTNNNTNTFMATPYKSSSSSTPNSTSSGGQVVVQGNICSMTYDPMCSRNMSFQRLLQAPPPSNGIVPPSHQSSSIPLQAYK